MIFKAARDCALLGLLFMVVYHTTNALSSVRPDVQTWAFAWEQRIPFVAWFIVPYWSVDLFFVAGPFVCRDDAELRLLRNRVALSIVVAGICFLVMPLTLQFQRPEPFGVFAPLMASLYSFDKPHNLFPSLHIALRTILAALFVSKTTGLTRVATHIWFSLIGCSTLFTWQHQFADVVGGFLLAAMCFQAFPSRPCQVVVGKNVRIGCYYLAGAFICLLLAKQSWPLGIVISWPAFMFGTLALGYFGLGCTVWGKSDGRLNWLTKSFFWPIRLGHEWSRKHYRKQSAPWDALADSVLIGSQPDEEEARALVKSGVTAVLDLTSEYERPSAFASINYLNIPVLDLTAPSSVHLREMAVFIEREQQGGKVYIHCKAGYSRTAAAAGAWLLATGRATSAEDACRILNERRPGMVIRPEIRSALEHFETLTGT